MHSPHLLQSVFQLSWWRLLQSAAQITSEELSQRPPGSVWQTCTNLRSFNSASRALLKDRKIQSANVDFAPYTCLTWRKCTANAVYLFASCGDLNYIWSSPAHKPASNHTLCCRIPTFKSHHMPSSEPPALCTTSGANTVTRPTACNHQCIDHFLPTTGAAHAGLDVKRGAATWCRPRQKDKWCFNPGF